MTPEQIKEARALVERLAGFTPGPWHQANGSEIHDRSVMFGESGERLGDTPMLIAEAYSPREEGNARLIAAAPDLHAHLTAALDEIERLKWLLTDMCNAFDEHVALPDANCSCHINPPCGDCTGYSFAREALAAARAALAGKTDQ